MLFLSKNALFDNKKGIRGGIPIVFPHFGPWPIGPQHGFARIQMWEVEQLPSVDVSGNVVAIIALVDNAETRKIWDFKFKLRMTLTLLKCCFSMDLHVTNTGDAEFNFTTLIHTYFRLPDVTKSRVLGLTGCKYFDKTTGQDIQSETREQLSVDRNIDNIYANVPDELTLTGGPAGRTIKITKKGFPDTVVWNPWVDGAQKMADFGDDEYPLMLCVEVGHVVKKVSLAPAQEFHASQTLQIQCPE
ncbi:PREDICTED: putative glucose-6-phosphate 1-epimerase isoform X2 [Priapulus caudatus]|nr:PREDICTED: putative glucose-6-phosphate 1-epimerase isoform X2 [Priapulus caudatus]